jgi:hypothetical protein
MNDTKLVRDKSDKNFSFSYYASVPDLFIQIFLLFFLYVCVIISCYFGCPDDVIGNPTRSVERNISD